jgi:hypothetical protein
VAIKLEPPSKQGCSIFSEQAVHSLRSINFGTAWNHCETIPTVLSSNSGRRRNFFFNSQRTRDRKRSCESLQSISSSLGAAIPLQIP